MKKKMAAHNIVYNKTTVGENALLHTNYNASNVSLFGLVGTFFSLLIALVKLAFWIAMVVAIIAFIIWIGARI